MKIYCRACRRLVWEEKESLPLFTPDSFKEKHGHTCPHCKAQYSDSFAIRDIQVVDP